MMLLRVLAIIGNTFILAGMVYLSMVTPIVGDRILVMILGILTPILSLIYLYKTRFYSLSEVKVASKKEKSLGLFKLWLQRKKLEEQTKIDNLKDK